MNETIGQIRSLLDTLEKEHNEPDQTASMRVFSGLELPDIIRDVVDLLLPNLGPHEATFYLYFLRHSIMETGNPHIRVSTRKLQHGVMRSTYKEGRNSGGGTIASGGLSLDKVRTTLRSLEAAGAIRTEGDANRDGTLYRILLPEEIPICQQLREEMRAPLAPVAAQETQADFYNVRENRSKVYERESYKCQYCDKQLTRFTATLDHVQPIAKGGDNSFDNLVTACRECNSRKNMRLLGDYLAES